MGDGCQGFCLDVAVESVFLPIILDIARGRISRWVTTYRMHGVTQILIDAYIVNQVFGWAVGLDFAAKVLKPASLFRAFETVWVGAVGAQQNAIWRTKAWVGLHTFTARITPIPTPSR